MRVFLALAAALLATPALAAPCDAFSEPLAYNACLARQGPAARAVKVGPAPREIEARRRPGRVGGRIVLARPKGRAELVFTPGR